MRQALSQLASAPAIDIEFWSQIGQRDDHKVTLSDAGMWERQTFLLQSDADIDKKIEVDGAGCPTHAGSTAAQLLLDMKTGIKELQRFKRATDLDDGIEKVISRLPHPDGPVLIDRTGPQNMQALPILEPLQGLAHLPDPVAEITAQGDVN